MTYKALGPVSRDCFVAQPSSGEDGFASTFRAKADLLNIWHTAFGVFVQGKLAAAICVTLSKRTPVVANLQLLHTFSRYRRCGYGGMLVTYEYKRVVAQRAQYFRVSSEHDAVAFYRSLGLKFWGTQKSGSYLCMHKLVSPVIATGEYVLDDVIRKAVFSKRRGGVLVPYLYDDGGAVAL